MWITKICTTVSKLKVLAIVGDHPKPVTPVLPQLTAPFPVWPFLARPLDGGGKENNFGFQGRLKKLV